MAPFRKTRSRGHGEPAGPLTADGLLTSDLWVDEQDADQRVAVAARLGRISPQRAAQLRSFVNLGYAVLPLALSEAACARLDEDVERLWRDRPETVAYAYHSLLRPFSLASDDHRQPSYRIADLHTFSETAFDLYLNRVLFEIIEAIFDEPAIAIQSLYFEWGSQQGLHRDPVYVRTPIPSHLAAAWIALEDVGPECGALVYMPGSHRLPYYEFEPGRFTFNFSRDGIDELQASQQCNEERCQAAGLELETFTCKRGDVLIWHHSLLHGGAYPINPALTRKSLVIHYTTLASMPAVRNSYLLSGEGAPTVLETDRRFERDGCHGFDSPLHAAFSP